METFTTILFIITLVVIALFFIVLIVTRIMKTISSSKKLVEIALTKVLLKKTNKNPNKLFVLKDREGNLLQVKFLPKVK